MSLKNIHILLFSLLILIGCTALGEKYTPAPPPSNDKALVYLFRTGVYVGGFWRTSFMVNNKEVAALHNGGYTWVHLDKGYNQFDAKAVNHKNLEFTALLKAGETYYVEFTQEGNFNVLRMVSPERGGKMIESYLYKKENQ